MIILGRWAGEENSDKLLSSVPNTKFISCYEKLLLLHFFSLSSALKYLWKFVACQFEKSEYLKPLWMLCRLLKVVKFTFSIYQSLHFTQQITLPAQLSASPSLVIAQWEKFYVSLNYWECFHRDCRQNFPLYPPFSHWLLLAFGRGEETRRLWFENSVINFPYNFSRSIFASHSQWYTQASTYWVDGKVYQ